MAGRKSAAKEYKPLQAVNEMDMSLKGLTEMPLQQIRAYSNLNSLNLCNNKITELGLEFATCSVQLTFLDLSMNAITFLPENIGLMVNLQRLDLYHNQIQRLPISMGDMTKLRWLDLKENPLVSTLVRICGPCSNQVECRTCARNVPLFMQQLQKKISAMEVNTEIEAEELIGLGVETSRLALKPSNVVQEVLLPPTQDRIIGLESETDGGTDTEIEGSVLTHVTTPTQNLSGREIIAHQPTLSRRRRAQQSSTAFVDNDASDTRLEPVKTSSQIKKKERHAIRKQSATSTSNTSELAEQLYEYYKPGLQTTLRYCLYVTCLTISSFILLGILFDQEYLRHFLQNKIEFPGLDRWLLPTHQIFQNAVQFGAHPHYLPMFRLNDDYEPGFLGKMWNFVTYFVSS